MSSIVQHAPRFSETDAVGIAHDLFGLRVSAKSLDSERDQNFHLETSDGKAFVLKLANATETYEVLDLQNQAMMHIIANFSSLNPERTGAPEVCTSVQGAWISAVEGMNGATHFVRLLTYLPGKPFALVIPHDKDLLSSLGRFCGNLNHVLSDFDHAAAHRDFHWDLKNARRVIERYVAFIDLPEKRDLVTRFLKRFQLESEPQLPHLPTSVIHNDANDYNVLVEPDAKWRNQVTGVIDFGDMVHTYTISELAIACAYAMLNKADPLSAAANVVGGYHQTYPLTEQELVVLFDLICMRLCMSVCHSANQHRMEPDNDYLRISEKPAWALLKKLADLHPRFAWYAFRQTCGLPAVPNAARIVDWLQDNQGKIGKIIDSDLHTEHQLVLDLGVGSQLLGGDVEGENSAALTTHIFQHMQTAGVQVAIGRYNEARLFYSAGQFEVPTDEIPERRSIHLGMDLYLQSGAAIYAPLAGKVHSFRNNSAHLDYGPAIILEHQTRDDDTFYTLYGHLSPESLQGLSVEAAVEKGACIGRVGETRTNGGWPPHVHFQIITDLLDEHGNFPGVARPSQRQIWLTISPDPNIILGIPQSCFPSQGRSHEAILNARRQHLGRNLSISYSHPLKIVRGRRQYLYTEDGQKYLDGVNNVCHVGHCHPHVVAAGQRQMPVLNTNTRYLHDNIIEYSRKLLAKFPEPLHVCYFVCTGSEANELALRMARTYTGRQDIITVDGAYHGNTQVLIDISPYKHDGPGGRGRPPWVHKVVMPDTYRGPFKATNPNTGIQYAEHVREVIDGIQSNGYAPAAFICESLLGCGGQIVLPDNYLREAFRHVRSVGGICIVDEVQVGFGRVGSHYWAFETQNVVPDIVTLGKPMGNGHPLAAVITTADIADAFANGMEYFNTFGGNPVSCAIGTAVMEVIEDEGLQENAQKAGNRLLEGLRGLMVKYDLIGDVRGLGLYAGVELVTDRETQEPATQHSDYVINRMRDYGILISTDGPMENVLKIKPPIVFTEDNADGVVDALDKIFNEDCLQI